MPARHTAGAAPAPCNHSNLDISANSPKLWKLPTSAWSRRSRQQHSRQQRPCNFCLRPQSQRIALSSVLTAAPTISKCPARSLRRLFEVSSPCRKNEQENRSFSRVWQPRRPPASPPAASKRARSHRSRTLARPASTITSFHTSTTFLTHLAQLTAAHALCALRQHPGTRFCPQAPSVTDPRSPNRPGVCFSSSASRPQTLAPPLRLKRSHPRAYLPTRLTPAQIAPSQNPPRLLSRPRRSFPPRLLSQPRRSSTPCLLSQPRRSPRPCFSLGLAAVHRSGFFRLRTLLRPASSLGLGALFSPLILSLGLAVLPRPISYLSLSALLRPGSCCLQFAACRFPPPLKNFIYKVKAFSRAHAHRKNNNNNK